MLDLHKILLEYNVHYSILFCATIAIQSWFLFQTNIFSFEILESIYKWKDCFNMIVFAHCDGSKEKRDEHKHSFLTKYYLKLAERFNEGFTNKPAKHFKYIGKKESLKPWYIQMDTLARYGCILLIVSVQSSLRI